MRRLRLAALAWLALALPAGAQAPPGPVTGLLAIGTIPPGTDMTAVRALLPEEVRDTVGLYLHGRIGQWFSLADRAGVVFVLNVTDVAAARTMLEALPLGRAHLSLRSARCWARPSLHDPSAGPAPILTTLIAPTLSLRAEILRVPHS